MRVSTFYFVAPAELLFYHKNNSGHPILPTVKKYERYYTIQLSSHLSIYINISNHYRSNIMINIIIKVTEIKYYTIIVLITLNFNMAYM